MTRTQSKVTRTVSWIAALLMPVLAGAALAIPALTFGAPAGGYGHTTSPVEQATMHAISDAKPVNEPTWESHGGAEGCSPMRDGVAADVVVVVTQGGDVVRMDFDKAWAVGQDAERANDVWVVGTC